METGNELEEFLKENLNYKSVKSHIAYNNNRGMVEGDGEKMFIKTVKSEHVSIAVQNI